MISISFPIAHFPTSVNLPSYVILPTYLIPEDDTPDVIPRHTMLRHAYHVSVTRNFRLTPITPPTPLRDLRPLIPTNPYASPPSVLRITRWRDARPSAARKQGSQAHVDSPLHHAAPLHHPAPPRPIPTHLFHVKHERTDRSMRMVFDMRPGWLPRFARSPSSSLRSSCAAGAYGIAQLQRG